MNTRRAFTLVEILTVIAIISILVALVTLAVAGAMRAAKRAKIGWEMSQIAMALELYKGEFGEYPPDFFDNEALVRHVRKRWPRYDFQDADQIRDDIKDAYNDAGYPVDFADTNSHAPLGALALWLGGFPNADGKLSGFGADPEHPFTLDGTFDGKAFIDWEVGEGKNVRFEDYGGGSVPVIGNEIQGAFVPFVYFRGKSSGGDDAYDISVRQFEFTSADGPDWCVPYVEEEEKKDGSGSVMKPKKWKNPTTYQLIHPGLDGLFGELEGERVITSGTGIGLQDLDNITNFSDYKELKSILP